MLEGVVQFVIELFEGLVVGLLNDLLLDGRNGLLLVVDACCSFDPEIFGEGLVVEGSGFDESGIGAGLGDEVILDSK